MSKKENWVWMPHPGHFVASWSCHYWLNTYVGGYVVSTIGEYTYDTNDRRKFEEIGMGRFYETYVFKARKEADPDWQCCPYVASDWSEIDSLGANTPTEARKNHLKLCNKWSKR